MSDHTVLHVSAARAPTQVFALVSVMELDQTRFPPNLASKDAGYTSFMSVLLMAHRHRSPVISMVRDTQFGMETCCSVHDNFLPDDYDR